jgi:hypothetical protein
VNSEAASTSVVRVVGEGVAFALADDELADGGHLVLDQDVANTPIA